MNRLLEPYLRRVRAYLPLTTLALAFAGGCASSYAVPGQPAPMEAFGVQKTPAGDPAVVQALAKRPAATFPTGLAVVRVQAPGYSSKTTQTWGRGKFCVVTTRDVEKEGVAEKLTQLPLITGVAPVNRLLLPEELSSDMDLRQAAATLHADILLVYTLDTNFQVQDAATPLTAITLGLSPTQNASVICTASAVLLDTRNGYVYGVAEATDRSNQLANAWTSDAAVDAAVKRTEAGAFAKLVGELEKTWEGVVQTYGGTRNAKT